VPVAGYIIWLGFRKTLTPARVNQPRSLVKRWERVTDEWCGGRQDAQTEGRKPTDDNSGEEAAQHESQLLT
jgi:hypothetical protein